MEEQHFLMAKGGKLASPPKRQAILVLGMHRSGTSALGGVINAMGAAAPKTLNPPNASNPRGYFESWPLVVAHDELLASAGSCWDDWRQLNPQWIHSKAAEHHRQKIKTLLVDEFGDEPLIFIKDPRICRFVPFMSSILAEMNISPVALLPVRNPLEIAYSLKQRDGIALPKSQLLWLRHVLEAEYHSRNMPRYFLPLQRFLIDWRYHMNLAAEKAGVIWPARSDRSDVKIEQFLAMDLYHERSSHEDIRNHPNITALVRTTYDILTTIAVDGESKELLDQLDRVRTNFDEGCDLFGIAAAAEELAVEQLRGELNTRLAEEDRLRQQNSQLVAFSDHQSFEINGLAAERDAFARAHNDVIAERDALTRAHNEVIAERDRFARALNDLIAERDGLALAFNDLIAERDGIVRVRNDLIAERDGLARAHSDMIAERDALIHERDSVVAERDALLASRSWRLTAPLRWMRLPFSR